MTNTIDIKEVFYVSSGFPNRPYMRDISDGDGVAVDFYRSQGRKEDDKPSFNCTALFYGKQAEAARKFLTPKKPVMLKGGLMQTINEKDGKSYVDNTIFFASFDLLPRNTEGDTVQGTIGTTQAYSVSPVAPTAPPMTPVGADNGTGIPA